jgi:hypothetical protein
MVFWYEGYWSFLKDVSILKSRIGVYFSKLLLRGHSFNTYLEIVTDYLTIIDPDNVTLTTIDSELLLFTIFTS